VRASRLGVATDEWVKALRWSWEQLALLSRLTVSSSNDNTGASDGQSSCDSSDGASNACPKVPLLAVRLDLLSNPASVVLAMKEDVAVAMGWDLVSVSATFVPVMRPRQDTSTSKSSAAAATADRQQQQQYHHHHVRNHTDSNADPSSSQVSAFQRSNVVNSQTPEVLTLLPPRVEMEGASAEPHSDAIGKIAEPGARV